MSRVRAGMKGDDFLVRLNWKPKVSRLCDPNRKGTLGCCVLTVTLELCSFTMCREAKGLKTTFIWTWAFGSGPSSVSTSLWPGSSPPLTLSAFARASMLPNPTRASVFRFSYLSKANQSITRCFCNVLVPGMSLSHCLPHLWLSVHCHSSASKCWASYVLWVISVSFRVILSNSIA